MKHQGIGPVSVVLFLATGILQGGTLVGHVRDGNWYARYESNPFGVGYYEYAVNANPNGGSGPGGFAATDVFGRFEMSNLAAGTYTVASWDVWWRSAFAFNVTVPASGATADVDLRLHATMWGYPAFWDDTAYYEFGQTFEASGPVTMIYLRNPLRPTPTFTLTVHEGGPGGRQIGVARSFNAFWDVRLIYGYGELPTVRGQTYYVRLRTDAPANPGILCQMDPRPDYSDPMPGGCLYLGNGATLTAFPERDLGLVIMSDDDGLLTNLHTRKSGNDFNGVTSIGQTFLARGAGLISAAFWLADPSDPTYVVRVRQDGPGGAQVGTTKRGRPARRSADPEMLVTWAPGECPLVSNQTYYVEVTRDGGGTFNAAYVNTSNPFPFGQAYRDGIAQPGTDLAGTIMEEANPGSASQPAVRITAGPQVEDRGPDYLTLRWNTSTTGDSRVEYAAETTPYTHTNTSTSSLPIHRVTLRDLHPHTLYHFRVVSTRAGYRPAVSRDMVICTLPERPNLLVNPDFESGAGPGPARAVEGWTVGGSLDLQAADGSWFGGLTPQSGRWFLEGAANAGNSDGYAWQRVNGITPGKAYTFSAWVRTDQRENGTWKYDVWDRTGRVIYLQLGIDPTGGTNPNADSVQWTPRMYSHRHYVNIAKTATAQSSALTVFVRMRGEGGEWHLYGVDNCGLTEKSVRLGQAFERPPNWSTAYNSPGAPPAQWTLASDGQSGSALHITNAAGSTSARVLTFAVETNTYYLVSLYGRCAGAPTPYVAECAVNLGNQAALQYALHPETWWTVQRFSQPGINGNGAVWRQYTRSVFTGAKRALSVGFRLASEPETPVAVSWDTLRVEPETPEVVPLIALDAQTLWQYRQDGANLGTNWREPDYDDSAWPAGPALLAAEDCACLPETIRTPITVGAAKPTFYFRHHFTLPSPVLPSRLRLRQLVDDGVVYYLNGAELFRVGVTNAPVAFGHLAARTIGNANYEGPFVLDATHLAPGENVLAAEVHQASATSSDVVFGATLDALLYPSQVPPADAALRVERQDAVLVLDWEENSMTLEWAGALGGPWNPAGEQNAPLILAATNGARFFRLRQP